MPFASVAYEILKGQCGVESSRLSRAACKMKQEPLKDHCGHVKFFFKGTLWKYFMEGTEGEGRSWGRRENIWPGQMLVAVKKKNLYEDKKKRLLNYP